MLCIAGVDIGGSTIKMAMTDDAMQILAERTVPTPQADPKATKTLQTIVETIREMLAESGQEEKDLLGIGVGVPGLVDFASGFVYRAPNLGWFDLPLAQSLAKALQTEVYCDNDANLHALGEMRFGKGQGEKNILLLTLGTGLGGGILMDGEILRGEHNVAAELGHICLVENGELCGCGQKGCLETYVNIRGMMRLAEEQVKQHPDSILLQKAEGDPQAITPKMVNEACQEQDPAALAVLAEYVRYLGMGLHNLISICNPGLVLLSGGISGFGERLLMPLREAVKVRQMHPVQTCRIETGILRQRAGVLGACALVQQQA